MNFSTRAALCIASFCLIACGGGGSGTIAGKVTFTDGTDATGLAVTLLGPVGKRVETGGGGAYSFDKLPKGVYQVSVEGADTRERRLSFGTESEGAATVTAPDLSFSPIGSLTGKVMNGAGPVAGATVYLSGSDRVSLTDTTGGYGFFEVPVGMYSVVAKASGAIPQAASAMVTLKRGKNEAMPLTLANDLSVTGKLEGTLTLFNGTSPKDIKVSVADVSAMTGDTGKFSLTLPPGDYEAFAEFAGYPKQSLGVAQVRTGQTTTLAAKVLSLYRAVPWASRISSTSWTATSESDIAVLQVNVDTDYSTEHYFVDTKTFERKLFAIGSISRLYLSKNGKWAAFVPNSGQGVVVVSSSTGQMLSFASTSVSAGPAISDDEGTLMFWAGSPQYELIRVDLGTGMATKFPANFGSAFQTNERFLARTLTLPPYDVKLITPTTAATVFTNMATFVPVGSTSTTLGTNTTAYATWYAYNCTTTCAVQIFGPTAAAPSTLTATIPLQPSPITGSTKEWVGLQWGGLTPGRIFVKVADGTHTTLPAATTELVFNETASRVVTISSPGVGTDVREDLVPPNPTSPVLLNTTSGISHSGWISPTRYMAFTSIPNRRLDIKAGVPTTDTDFSYDAVAQSPLFTAPGVMWLKTSTMKRVASVYDADLVPDTFGTESSFNFTLIGTKSSVLNPTLGKYAAFTDGVAVHVLDGMRSEVRKLGVGSMPFGFNNPPFIATDRIKVQRVGGTSLLFLESGRLSTLSEPGLTLSSTGTASLPKGGTAVAAIKSSEPRNILYVGFVP